MPPTTRPVGPKCANASTMPAARKVLTPQLSDCASGRERLSSGCCSRRSLDCSASWLFMRAALPFSGTALLPFALCRHLPLLFESDLLRGGPDVIEVAHQGG